MLEEFLAAYIEAALWSSTDNDDKPLDSTFSRIDLAPECEAKMHADCEAFLARCERLIRSARLVPDYGKIALAGYDFWLTRNGHGSGFWDSDWDMIDGQLLTIECKRFGEVYLYVGDDRRIHHG